VKVGFAGIGRMGLPMARNVQAAGLPLVVWNRTAGRTEPLAADGAEVAREPAELAGADVVVTMLADADAVREVVVGSGLADRLRPGSIVVDMSTIGPAAAQELATTIAAHGAAFLDAPVSGSVSVAESGQLFAMVGGDAEAYERAAPVLDAMTKGHLLLGPAGAGAAMKLAVNAMIAVTNEAIAETLTVASFWGIETERAYDVLASGALASPFVLYKRNAFLHPETEPVAFTASLMRKDVGLARRLADELGVRTPALAAAETVLEDAVRDDLGERDMAVVIELLDQREGRPTT
jgi:3-hydroxyisobutyrate dehydrogenase-like beta-hydroxyacid dehydrogenase